MDDRKSTNVYIIFIGANPIIWCTRKQKVVARSSIETEYWVLAIATSDITWIQSLLDELGVTLRTSPLFFVTMLVLRNSDLILSCIPG